MSNAPTVGRGAMLARLLAAQQQQQAQPGDQSEEAAQAPPVPRGRAAQILGRQQAASDNAVPSTSTAQPGRGRALLAALAQLQSTAAVNAAGVPPVEEALQDLNISGEDPPVEMHGTLGTRISATANYIRLNMDKEMGIFEYEVKFDPPVDSMNIRFRFVSSKFGRKKTFDGAVLYLPTKLPDKVTVMPVEGLDGERVTMTVIYKKKKRLIDCMHVYNVCFKRILGILKFVQLGRSFFNPHAIQSIPQHKLEIWPGYVTAVDEYEGGIMLCLDTSHRVLRKQTVLEVIRELSRRDGAHFRNSFMNEVIGQSVLTSYNKKLYKVDDVDWTQTPMSTFKVSRKGAETEMSYKDYYKNQYAVDVLDQGQPLLISNFKRQVPGSTKKEEHMICLIPELCNLTGLTDAMTADFKVMKDIAQFTRITPDARRNGLQKFIQNVNASEEATEVLAMWGLSLDPETAQVHARVQVPEDIKFGKGMTHRGTPEADWNNALSRNSVITAINLDNWCIIHTVRNAREVGSLTTWMMKLCPSMGINCSKPMIKQINNDSTDSFLRAIKELHRTPTQIVVIICPTARDDRYAAIKKLCCADQPIPSQVINSRTLIKEDKNRSIVIKIALQINCKLGGTLWSVGLPPSFRDTMVIGFDTYHDPSKRGSSVGGFVASLNADCTKWYSRVCIQEPQQELIDNLKINFTAAVQRFFELNHVYPKRIFIYRDGLGDGQLAISRDFEVPQLQSCFPHISEAFMPKLTMIICQKRINTRIFQVLGDKLGNPPPGTVVDNTVTRRNWYDFFLVSQHVRQGTVTPTHYVVVYDDCQLSVDNLQKLTFKLCHLYYNWPGTIRVPAPVQYAHKLAQLVGQCVKRAPSLSLSDKLYFL